MRIYKVHTNLTLIEKLFCVHTHSGICGLWTATSEWPTTEGVSSDKARSQDYNSCKHTEKSISSK